VVGSPGTALMTGLIRIYKHLGVISSVGQRMDFPYFVRRGNCFLLTVVLKTNRQILKELNDRKIQFEKLLTGHPRFFNQLSNGVDVISMAGEWLTATANTNMFTYEISPVFILMEHMTLKKMREIIGYKGGDSILAPGKLNSF